MKRATLQDIIPRLEAQTFLVADWDHNCGWSTRPSGILLRSDLARHTQEFVIFTPHNYTKYDTGELEGPPAGDDDAWDGFDWDPALSMANEVDEILVVAEEPDTRGDKVLVAMIDGSSTHWCQTAVRRLAL